MIKLPEDVMRLPAILAPWAKTAGFGRFYRQKLPG
jgi:hypothetical protein